MRKTRQERAAKLFLRLSRGPQLSSIDFQGSDASKPPHEVAMNAYRVWARSWILEEAIDLIPELRAIKKELEVSLR